MSQGGHCVSAALVPGPLSPCRRANDAGFAHVLELVVMLLNETPTCGPILADAHEVAAVGHVSHGSNRLGRSHVRAGLDERVTQHCARRDVVGRRLQAKGAVGLANHHGGRVLTGRARTVARPVATIRVTRSLSCATALAVPGRCGKTARIGLLSKLLAFQVARFPVSVDGFEQRIIRKRRRQHTRDGR